MQQSISTFLSLIVLSLLWSVCTARAMYSRNGAILNRKEKHGFSLEATYNHNRTRNFHQAMSKAYGRYSIQRTMVLSSSASASKSKAVSVHARADGTVSAASKGGDSEYICTVTVGGQQMRLAFDTGSADLWVFSDLLPQTYPGHRVYSSSKSTTYAPMTGSSWYITYADGTNAGGTMGTETVAAGAAVVSNLPFGLAETVSDGYVQDTYVDGLLGLSFSTINTVRPNQVSTFFEAAIPSLKKALFTVTLKHLKSGSYDFGYINSKRYTGKISYVKVYQNTGYWQIFNTAWQVGTGSSTTEAGTYAILDTGTSLLLMSDAAVSAYYAQVSGATFDNDQGAYIFPCASTLPDFSVNVGSGSSAIWLKIPGGLLNYGIITSDGLTCYGGIQSRGTSDINILGDIFYKAFFVVMDKGKSRAGFATQAT